MKLYFIFLSALVFFGSSCKVAKTTQIYLVRHAERTNPPQDDLIPAGVTRANELSRVLFQAGIDSIFTTDLNRTKKTVQPLARAKRLPLILYSENDLLIDRILKNNKGKMYCLKSAASIIPRRMLAAPQR